MKTNCFDTTTEGGSEGRACYRGSSRGRACLWPPVVLALIVAAAASAQTMIDLKTQAKSVDFSGANSTKPSKAGTVLPATCSVGETFLKTDAPAGQNFYACTAGNVWSLQGAVIPGVAGFANMVLATDGSALVWKALGGDASGPPASLTVSKLQGRAVSVAGPAAGQALVWNSGTTQWEPQSLSFGQITGAVTDAQVGTGINAAKIGSGAVSNTVLGYLANLTSDLQTQLNGKSATSHTHTAAGDASGALGSLTVTALQNRAVSAAAPANGQSLVWSSAASQWQPQNQNGGVSGVFGRTGAVTAQSGDYSFGQISGTIADAQVGTGINANKIGGGAVSSAAFGYLANVNADLQAQLNGKAATNQSLAGDTGGNLGATIVMGLRNRAVSAAAPSNGQALVWNSGMSQWEAQNQTGGIPSVFGRTGAVTAQAGDYSFGQIAGSVTDAQLSPGISAAKIGSGAVSSAAFGYLSNVTSDVQAQLNGKAAASHTHTASGDVTGGLATTTVTALQNRAVSPAAPANGQSLVWNAGLSQWQPQNQNGGVSGVFGRTGAVTAQTGDYAFTQIAGTVADAQISTGINANKIGAGVVSNGAFGYLANVTSDVQTQLNSKASTGQGVTGDLTGTLGSPTVAALQNRPISPVAPANGQALVWNSAAGQWQPQNAAGGVPSVFGRAGAVTAQTGDYSFAQISGSVADAQVGTGINANKIGSGSVSNTTFGYLSNVNSDIQTQLTSKINANFALTGDLGGTLAHATVGALQSRSISTASPANGQVLAWNTGSNQWEPQSLSSISAGGSSAGSYSSSFVSQTAVTIAGTAHQLGTANLLVGCYDTATPNMRVQPNTVSVDPTNYDVIVTFAAPQSGRCVVAAGGSGAVSGGASGGASMVSQLGDFGVTRTSGSILTVGPNCSPTTPCNVRFGSNTYRFVTGTTVTLSGGTGMAYIYVDPNGVLTVGHNLTLSCASPCSAVSGVTGFPVNSIPVYMWTATGGSWDASGGIDERAVLSTRLLAAGLGVTTLETGAGTSISVDTAVVPTFLAATAVLGFGPIATGTCATDKTFALPGAAVGDAVAPGWPGGIEAGLIGSMRISAPNTIAVRLCNFSGTSITPANATYRGTVVRSF